MSEISDLEGRIAAAMDRISAGVEAYGANDGSGQTSDAGGDVNALQRALDDEKLASAQLEERLKALHSRQEDLEADLAAKSAEVVAVTSQLQARVEELDALQEEMEAVPVPVPVPVPVSAPVSASDDMDEGAQSAGAGIDLDEGRAIIDDLTRRLRRLRGAGRALRAASQQLRDAAEQAVPDPSLINNAMKAELDHCRALRAVEETEMAAIAAVLRPLLAAGQGKENMQEAEDA